MANMLGINEAIQFSEAGEVAPEQTLLRVGRYKHPKHGMVNITPDIMRSFVSNHKARVRRVDDAVDFGHESKGPAAAWITNLRFDEKDGTLRFVPDWSSKGRESVRGKEYKYISADFTFDYEDNETGKKFGPTLNGAGLTNRPFVKGMEAIQLSEGDCDMNLEQALQMIEQLKAQLAQQQGQMQPMQQQHQQLQAKFSEAETEITSLKEKLAGFEKEANDRAAKEKVAARSAKFDEMLGKGLVCEAQRVLFMDEEHFDAVKFAEAFVPAANKDSRLSEEEKEAAARAAAAQGPEAKILQLAETLVSEKKASDKTAAISIVLSDPANKALVEEYTKNVQL